MAVTLTLEEFKQFHPEVNAPDVVIQAYIDYVQDFIDAGVCWSDNMTKIIGYNIVAHFVTLSTSILFRDAGVSVIWPDIAALAGIGLAFFLIALARFRRTLAA